MALKLEIFTIGKRSPSWLQEGIEIYCKRLKSSCLISFIYGKDNAHLRRWLEKASSPLFLLDERGKELSSTGFSSFLMEEFTKGGGHLCFVIGGADGIPDDVKKAYPSLRFSSLTLPHQMVRLLLVEQIYRAFTIAEGRAYHK